VCVCVGISTEKIFEVIFLIIRIRFRYLRPFLALYDDVPPRSASFSVFALHICPERVAFRRGDGSISILRRAEWSVAPLYARTVANECVRVERKRFAQKDRLGKFERAFRRREIPPLRINRACYRSLGIFRWPSDSSSPNFDRMNRILRVVGFRKYANNLRV